MQFYKILAIGAITLAAWSLAGCDLIKQESDRPATSLEFPRPFRPVSKAAGTSFSTEAARDEAGEANMVMDWAGIESGSTVADIGAGEGYYTIRLSKRVGDAGAGAVARQQTRCAQAL